MGKYIVKRILQVIPMLFILSLIVFMMVRLIPGDPVDMMLGMDIPKDTKEYERERLGLNDPLYIQYFRFVGNALHGDLGTSIFSGKPVVEELAKRFKDPKEPFKVVIVRDMWLTGFDVPCLHTMYVDKPMRGHGLMQAIARVNRVFKDKPGGLVVDYLGLADQLKYALANYTESGGKGQTAIDQEEAVAVMLERYEVCCGIFHGFDWSTWKTGGPQERLSVLPAAQEHVLGQDDGKNRLVKAVGELSKAFALAVPHEKALEIRDDVAFFQAVRSVLTKSTGDGRRSPEEIEACLLRGRAAAEALMTTRVRVHRATGRKTTDPRTGVVTVETSVVYGDGPDGDVGKVQTGAGGPRGRDRAPGHQARQRPHRWGSTQDR